MRVVILGIDLAWGRRMPDAVACIEVEEGRIQIGEVAYLKGDTALLEYIKKKQRRHCLLAIDAPMVCQNETGSRPVDKECNRLFRKVEAGCHPVNLQLCARPLELAEAITELGFKHTPEVSESKVVMEVYPHPTMVRWFQLEKTIKYKKGLVAEKRTEFRRYQSLFKGWIVEHFPELTFSTDLENSLSEEWSKKTEDLLDAYFCAFIGLWHFAFKGKRSQVLGDLQTGFMVVPYSAKIS